MCGQLLPQKRRLQLGIAARRAPVTHQRGRPLRRPAPGFEDKRQKGRPRHTLRGIPYVLLV
eukprot:8435091-Karenia_brevis.AAC.1